MAFQNLYKIRRVWILAALLATPALGQIQQQNPELCGRPAGTVPVPANVAAVTDPDEHSHVSIGLRDGSLAKLEIYGVIRQACLLGRDKLAIFGTHNGSDANDMYVVDRVTGAMEDALLGDDPAMSPDQRWVAYRDHIVPQSQVSQSDEYFLYDLTKSSAENKLPGVERGYEYRGRVMYPVVPGGIPFNNHALPDNQFHQFEGGFYWAPDSKALVFADKLLLQWSIVLVRIGVKDKITTYVRPVAVSEVCPAPPTGMDGYIDLSRADLVPAADGSLDVVAQFGPAGRACVPTTHVYHSNEFKLAEIERHAPPLRKKRAVPIK